MVRHEERVERRFFAPTRESLDRQVAQLAFIVAHVDFAAFVKEETQRLVRRVGHALAGGILQAVRAVERSLTRTVRSFRSNWGYGYAAASKRASARIYAS